MSLTLLKAVCRSMERIAPLRLAEKWDNVGLLLESPIQKPTDRHRVLLTIDLTTAVFAESVSKSASVIVAYHPTIFKGLKSLTLNDPLQTTLLRCAAEGISVFSPHTALDSVWGGVNDWLAEGVICEKGDGEVSALVGEKIGPAGESEGAEGRLVTLKVPIPMDVLERRIKSLLNLSQLQVGYPATTESRSASVRSIAICAGSGGSMLLGTEADVYFTGEMSHHEVLAAVAAGKHVVLCGHTNTERGYLPILASKLRSELEGEEIQAQGLGNVEVLVSEADCHPLQFV
ncbi:NGG1 interacting factor 3-like protein [Cyathus striatus]|nr:NGG1 interacting factor 3-like protein [Cyathus striatus]